MRLQISTFKVQSFVSGKKFKLQRKSPPDRGMSRKVKFPRDCGSVKRLGEKLRLCLERKELGNDTSSSL
jgi:hypothetical protein